MDSENDYVSEVSEYRQLELQFRQEFHVSNDKVYYVLSKKFIDAWKRRVGYDQTPTNEHIPKGLNQELIVEKLGTILKYDPVDTHMWNVHIDPNLQEGVDFEVVSEKIWMFFSQKYSTGKAIPRDSSVTNGFKTVNLNLVKLKMAIVFPSTVSKFKQNKTGNVIKGEQYVSRSTKLKDYITLFQQTLQTVTGYTFAKTNSVRLYTCPPDFTVEKLEAHMTSELKDCNYYDDPVFELVDSVYLDPEKFDTIEDCMIEPEQLVVMDAKEYQKTWCVKNPNFPMEGKCEGCYNYQVLSFPCECKKVSYCTEDCRIRDIQYHKPKCEKTDSDEETMSSLTRTELSIDGKCGLRNLGNTCFMNSGIQCLSNTPVLCEYILSDTYKNDINTDNPLGTKGELVNKFAHLMKRLWLQDKSSHPPFSFKRAIGKFQPQFQGYQQHDSQELITYLLDGLHEDLNRIKKKPYVEQGDHNGRPDKVVAAEAWENYRKRNDSIIVDNMYGLYKSKLKCPACGKESITFDPYLMVNVSIPQSTMKSLEINYLETEVLWDLKSMTYQFEKTSKMTVDELLQTKEVKQFVGGLPNDQLIMSIISNYAQEDVCFVEGIREFKKKLKSKRFYIRKLLPQEIQIPDERRVQIVIHESYKSVQNYSWKRDITPFMNFYYDIQTNCKQIHLYIFQIHLGLLSSFEGLSDIKDRINAQGLEAVYESTILDQFYYLEFKSNQRYQQNCSFCDKSSCNDCTVPYVETGSPALWIESDKELKIEVHLVWKRGFSVDGRVEDIYDDWLRSKAGPVSTETQIVVAEVQSKHVTELSLQECLKYSAQPEQLEEDNTWYCNQCKDHVQAYKTMEIYSTSDILIFHLKRFKNSNKYFKSKLEALIHFPIEGFDVSPFVKEATGPIYYDLYAISNHYGGLGGGHYTAFAKNRYDNQWYNFDDSHVSPVKNTSELLTSAAYVLFYKRRS